MADHWDGQRSGDQGRLLARKLVEWVDERSQTSDATLVREDVLTGAVLELAARLGINAGGVPEERVTRELEALSAYADAVAAGHRADPTRDDILDSGRGYIGGALTALHHVGLLDFEQYQGWFKRLNDKLPPTDWVGG